MRIPFSALLLAAALALPASSAAPGFAPEFTHADAAHWINSPPLTRAGLRGEVVLIELWTFDCINCRRSLPWLIATYDRYKSRGFTVIGVHTPELANERIAANVRAAVQSLQIRYPVMIDEDYSYWRALNNQYWPAFYLLDRRGVVTQYRIGEIHPGDENANALESAIDKALASPAPH